VGAGLNKAITQQNEVFLSSVFKRCQGLLTIARKPLKDKSWFV